MTYLLKAEHVSKTFYAPYPLPILQDISLTVQKEESIAIIGKSGEGKTTLLHILGLIEPATKGTIFFSGKEQTTPNTLRNEHIGFVFQNFHLLQDFSVLDNLLLPIAINRKSTKRGSSHFQRAESLLERVDLEHRVDFPVQKLSGGEKQRLAIARALINDPEIIMADEPTGNLDHATAQNIQSLLLECVKEEKKALLLVTHNEDFASLLGKQYKLEEGKLINIA